MLAKFNFVTTVLNKFYLLRQIEMYDVSTENMAIRRKK
jgi:hypothetical protein